MGISAPFARVAMRPAAAEVDAAGVIPGRTEILGELRISINYTIL
jgi:hypothetical protein